MLFDDPEDPDNEDRQYVKIADFGIGRIMKDIIFLLAATADGENDHNDITKVTNAYLAPEVDI